MGGRPGSRRTALAVAVLLGAASVAGCGSRRTFDAVAAPVAPVATAAPLVAAPTTAVAAQPVLVGEEASSSGVPTPIPEGAPVVGRMVLPRLGLDAAVLEGDTLDVLSHGPGHRIGSALPGQIGNVVLAGHRTTWSRPFRDLDQLQPGDGLWFETSTGTYQYEFVAHDVVSPSRGDITDQPYGYVATLYACHPPGSARSRLVAYFRMVSAPEAGQPDPSTIPAVPLPFT